jgi:hypothetical protein
MSSYAPLQSKELSKAKQLIVPDKSGITMGISKEKVVMELREENCSGRKTRPSGTVCTADVT